MACFKSFAICDDSVCNIYIGFPVVSFLQLQTLIVCTILLDIQGNRTVRANVITKRVIIPYLFDGDHTACQRHRIRIANISRPLRFLSADVCASFRIIGVSVAVVCRLTLYESFRSSSRGSGFNLSVGYFCVCIGLKAIAAAFKLCNLSLLVSSQVIIIRNSVVQISYNIIGFLRRPYLEAYSVGNAVFKLLITQVPGYLAAFILCFLRIIRRPCSTIAVAAAASRVCEGCRIGLHKSRCHAG